MSLGPVLPPLHAFRCAADALSRWCAGDDSAGAGVRVNGYGAAGARLDELLQIRAAGLRLASIAAEVRAEAADQGWGQDETTWAVGVAAQDKGQEFAKHVWDLCDRFVSWPYPGPVEMYRTAGFSKPEIAASQTTNATYAWVAASARLAQEGKPVWRLAGDDGSPVALSSLSPPWDGSFWSQVAGPLQDLDPPGRVTVNERLTECADRDLERTRQLCELVTPALPDPSDLVRLAAGHPAVTLLGATVSGLRWPTDIMPSAEWAYIGMVRAAAAQDSAAAPDADTAEGLQRTARLVVAGRWASIAALRYAGPGIQQADVEDSATEQMSRFLRWLPDWLTAVAHNRKPASGEPWPFTPQALSAAPSTDIVGMLYAGSPQRVAAFWHTVLTHLTDRVAERVRRPTAYKYRLDRIRFVLSAFGQPLDTEVLRDFANMHAQEDPDGVLLDWLTYATAMASRSLASAARGQARAGARFRDHPVGELADWQVGYATEPESREACGAVARVAGALGLPSYWMHRVWVNGLAAADTPLAANPLAGGTFWSAGSAEVAAVRAAPAVRWMLRCRHPRRERAGREVGHQLVVSEHGIVATNVHYHHAFGEWAASPGADRYAVYDPDNGRHRRDVHRAWRGIAVRAVLSAAGDGTTVAHDLITGAPVRSRPAAPPDTPVAPHQSHDGIDYQTESRAAGVTYRASGVTIGAYDQDGACLWQVSLADLLDPALPRLDEYPPDLGDRGYGVRAMTPAPGRLYVLTTEFDLLCLEEPDPAVPPAAPAPVQIKRPEPIRLPEEIERATGYRYCAPARIVHDDGITHSVMLCGSEPYTARLVYDELASRGYTMVKVAGEGGWAATVEAMPRETYRLWVDPGSRDCTWKSVLTDRFVVLNRGQRCWAMWWHTEGLNDDDKFLHITREQAERIAPAFGAELPPRHVLDQIAEQAWARMKKHWNRSERFYRGRAELLRPRQADIQRWASDLAATPPLREPVTSGYAPSPVRIAATPPVPIGLDEQFPLMRLCHGCFDGPILLLANRLTLSTPAGDLVVTLQVESRIRDLEFLAVTPFCPEEGYIIDDADTDPVARADKLRDTFWGHVITPEHMFPVSPRRLSVELHQDSPGATHQKSLIEGLNLELAFPDGSAYLGAPSRHRHNERTWIYEQFVPADRGQLAFVPGIAPDWVSINVPDSAELLKTITARLRRLPHRPRPGREGYFEH
jgi:hypothetical protein